MPMGGTPISMCVHGCVMVNKCVCLHGQVYTKGSTVQISGKVNVARVQPACYPR